MDFFVISSGEDRMKIWDTVKGQVQTEFADIVSTGETNFFGKPERGRLSADYTCMKWLAFDRKKMRKLRSSILVLGTGIGDVLAVDVAAGQLKWRVSDCDPGGVSYYTAGADGNICRLEPMTGNLLGKFRASSKTISNMPVSPVSALKQLKLDATYVACCSCHVFDDELKLDSVKINEKEFKEGDFKKPCYVLALVAGQLESRDNSFVTRLGCKVAFRIWPPALDIPKGTSLLFLFVGNLIGYVHAQAPPTIYKLTGDYKNSSGNNHRLWEGIGIGLGCLCLILGLVWLYTWIQKKRNAAAVQAQLHLEMTQQMLARRAFVDSFPIHVYSPPRGYTIGGLSDMFSNL